MQGETALHGAAHSGDRRSVELLLAAGVDIDIQNYEVILAVEIHCKHSLTSLRRENASLFIAAALRQLAHRCYC